MGKLAKLKPKVADLGGALEQAFLHYLGVHLLIGSSPLYPACRQPYSRPAESREGQIFLTMPGVK